MGIGYGDGTYRRRKVGSRAHPIPDLVEIVLQVGFELLDRLTIRARCTQKMPLKTGRSSTRGTPRGLFGPTA